MLTLENKDKPNQPITTSATLCSNGGRRNRKNADWASEVIAMAVLHCQEKTSRITLTKEKQIIARKSQGY